MNFAEAMMIAGIGIMVGGCGFLLVNGIKAARRAGGREDGDRGQRLDLYMLFVWGGMLLVQISNMFFHADASGTFHLASLTLASTAGTVLVFGGFAGRLLLRREMRWRGEQSHLPRA